MAVLGVEWEKNLWRVGTIFHFSLFTHDRGDVFERWSLAFDPRAAALDDKLLNLFILSHACIKVSFIIRLTCATTDRPMATKI
jgi:hypothetical protein